MSDPWWKRGACIDADHLTLDDWLPGERKTRSDYSPRQQASIDACKAVCAGCPVIVPCRADAMATADEKAIRGGLTYEERMDLGQARALPRRPSNGGLRRGPKPRPINHGTDGGYQTHLRRDDRPCDACREANSRKTAEYRKANGR